MALRVEKSSNMKGSMVLDKNLMPFACPLASTLSSATGSCFDFWGLMATTVEIASNFDR